MRRDEARGPADALRAQKRRKPGPRSSYLWAWGAGTHAAAAATSGGSPRSWRSWGRGRRAGAGTRRPELSRSAGWGGAAPASLGDSLCRRPFSMPRF